MKAKEIWNEGKNRGRTRGSRNPFKTRRKLATVILFHLFLLVGAGYAISIVKHDTLGIIAVLAVALIIFIIGNYLLAE